MKWRGVLLSVAAAAACAAAATWLVTYQPTAQASGDTSIAQYPIEPVAFSDAQPVLLTLMPAPERDVASPATGTVTSMRCKPGTALATGDILLGIDQRPIIVIVTTAPVFRDLNGGERGADVKALQAALRSLSYAAPETGRFDWQTRDAVQEFMHDRGVTLTGDEWGTLQMSRVVWVPPGSTVAGCPLRVGDAITAGGAIASLVDGGGTITYAAPATQIEGARVLTVGDTRVEAAGSPLTDEAAVAAVFASPAGTAALKSTDKTLSAQWELATPVEAYPVPPSSLFGIADGAACVSSAGTVSAVTILASSLGTTYVTFSGAPPAAVDVFPPPGAACG